MDQGFNKFCNRIRHICTNKQNSERQALGWDYNGCQALCPGTEADPLMGGQGQNPFGVEEEDSIP